MSTILVIDDNPDMHRLYKTALQRPGYRLLQASSGADALLVMGDHFPDVIVLDLAMPTMDGVEFLRVLRQQPEWQTIPVIVITAFSTGNGLEFINDLGVTEHLVKANFSVKELRARITKCLGGAAATGESQINAA
jgi:CheY-like chemotaxis protein